MKNTATKSNALRIGWGQADLTPERPVLLAGQFHARVSEGVRDPVTATALAIESSPDNAPGDHAVMVSCDFVGISDLLRDSVRGLLRDRVPGLDPMKVFLNATHTHTAPEVRAPSPIAMDDVPKDVVSELGAMLPQDYVAFAAERIAGAVEQAWTTRAPGGVGWGLGQAVVGHNRRWTSFDGTSTMYGNTNTPNFSHIEGYEDHGVNVLATWDAARRLTGLVVNLACSSQVSEQEYTISADYWHETRQELRRRLGKELFILAQCSTAGDQSPHVIVGKTAEERMLALKKRNQREDIALRIADTVTATLPFLEQAVEWNPPFVHRVETLALTRRRLSQNDVQEALAEAKALRENYAALRTALDADPAAKQKARWYVALTAAHRRANWLEGVATRYEDQQAQPTLPAEVHVIRLGDMAFASNPFECYLDFGMQIKARSRAVQTFLVQLAGEGTYLPTARSVSGKSYGAIPASTPVGPDGGRELAEGTVAIIDALWADP